MVYARYFEQAPVYEFLHDLERDPDQLENLVSDPAYRATLDHLRARTDALRDGYGGAYDRDTFRARPASAASVRPNLLLIIGDDQSWTDFGFMGHQTINTPNLDNLAAAGAVFTRGYVPTALCRPSLATLATGRYPHAHGVTGNDPAVAGGAAGRRVPERPDLPSAEPARHRAHRRHPHAPSVTGRRRVRQLPVGQMVGGRLPTRWLHGGDDAR